MSKPESHIMALNIFSIAPSSIIDNLVFDLSLMRLGISQTK